MVAEAGEAMRVLVIFSDGEEAYSKDNVARTVQAATERNIRLYPVLLHNPLEEPKRAAGRHASDGGVSESGRGVRADRNTAALARPNFAANQQHAIFLGLGRETGGSEYIRHAPGKDVINDVLKKVARELESTYVAGYYPQVPPGEKREHSVQAGLVSKARGKLRGAARKAVY